MLRLSMLISCIFMTNTGAGGGALDDNTYISSTGSGATRSAADSSGVAATTTATPTTTPPLIRTAKEQHTSTTTMVIVAGTNYYYHIEKKREIGGSSNNNDFDKYAVTCYTCVNVSDNLVCNQFAIDRPCKPGETFCHTLHIMDSKGTSVLVNKKCTTDRECQRNKVGCVEIDSQKMCVSCCDQDYCNVDVPTNSSTATFDDRITKMRMIAKNLFGEPEKALTTSIKDSHSSAKSSCIFLVLFKLLLLLLVST